MNLYLKYIYITYSVCVPFKKNKERIENFKETGDSRYICQNKLDKAYFQHNMAYGDLTRKYCVIRHLILLKIQNMMDINVNLIHWFTNFFYKKSTSLAQSETLAMPDKSAFGGATKNEIIPNKELAEEVHKPIIR